MRTKKLVLAAMFLAIGMVLPLFTMQIKEIGDTLLPMHFPVLLCGLICGWKYGLAVGFLLPFARFAVFGMPPMPNAVWMAMELATYGFVIGFAYEKFAGHRLRYVYASLILAMLSGRLVWGLVKVALLGLGENGFTLAAFLAGGFLDALPGIVLQLILIPGIMALVNRKKK